MFTKPKTFADCSLYAKTNAEGFTAEKQLIDFLINGQRINYGDPAFKNIRDNLKSRVNAAVLYRLLQNGGIHFVIAKRELPAAFKIFYAKDPKSASKHKAIFVDVTGLIYEQGGVFYCKDIDKFSTYLLGVLAIYLYYLDNNKLLRNGALQRSSVSAFCKMFGGLLDYLRITGYMENKQRILYITGVYFGTNVMGLDISTAQKVSMVANKMSIQDAKAADYYYVAEDEFTDIDTFCNALINTFKLKGLTTGVVLDRWYFLYGKGTHFALELYPAFLQTIMYAYSGTYLNNWKRIESVTGRDMTDIATTVLRIGAESIQNGFAYESADDRDNYRKIYLSEADPDPTNATTNQQGHDNFKDKKMTAGDVQKVVQQNMNQIKAAANDAQNKAAAAAKPSSAVKAANKVNDSKIPLTDESNEPPSLEAQKGKAAEAKAETSATNNANNAANNSADKDNIKKATVDKVTPASSKSDNNANETKTVTVNDGDNGKVILTKDKNNNILNDGVQCLVDHLEDDLKVPEAGEKKTLFTDILDDNPMEDAKK